MQHDDSDSWKPQAPAALAKLLERRASLLQPPPTLIERGIQQCVLSGEAPLEVSASDAEPAEAAAPRSGVEDTLAHARTIPDGSGASADTETGSHIDIEMPIRVTAASSRQRKISKATDALAPGTVIAGYRLRELLGVGGMGQVYRAEQVSMNREVAFKVLPRRLAGNKTFRDRFLREARAAGRLHHPHLIGVHDVNQADGILFFSMELVEGDSAQDLIEERGRLDENEALEIVRQTLTALAYAHTQGVVHRDIKPDNLMITHEGVVKVADLGLSLVEEEGAEGSAVTVAGAMMGTPYYMPPEQAQDAHSADARSDVYAVGATLYHLVVGKVPFTGSTPMEVLVNANTQALRYPEGVEVSKGVRDFIARCMAKDPKQRPKDADVALHQVERLLGSAPALPIGAARQHHRRRRGGRRRLPVRARVIILGIGVVVIAVLVIVADIVGEQHRWSDLQTRQQAFVESRAYDRALAALDEAEANWAADEQARLATWRREIRDAWRAWAVPQVAAFLEGEVEALAAESRYAAIRQAIDRFEGVHPELLVDEAQALLDAARARNHQRIAELRAYWGEQAAADLVDGRNLLAEASYAPEAQAHTRRGRGHAQQYFLDGRGLVMLGEGLEEANEWRLHLDVPQQGTWGLLFPLQRKGNNSERFFFLGWRDGVLGVRSVVGNGRRVSPGESVTVLDTVRDAAVSLRFVREGVSWSLHYGDGSGTLPFDLKQQLRMVVFWEGLNEGKGVEAVLTSGS